MNLKPLLLALTIGLTVMHAVCADEHVSFNRDIRPILSDNCFYCHGFDEKNREADLRLDTFDGATEYAIVPGDPGDSSVMQRISSDDADEIMPPPDSEKKLTKQQITLIKRWIQQGAEYEEHWSWKPLTPPIAQKQSVQDGAATVDAFLKQGWQNNNAHPVEAASARDRLRRLSLDLRGLLPTHQEVTAFTKDPSDTLFFQFRDRWMKELPFAEHQAVRWLDLVRWADTSGFVSDEPIASGAYRAWIIQSIRDNQPFDAFSIEQLAGDLLAQPTDDQYIASGYNRIVNTNCEAGAIEEEQLYKLKGEHVRALGTVWLGMTTGCAECHDHKFDPLSAKDYYSLAAFFDDLVEAGVYTPGDRREPLHYAYQQPEGSAKDAKLAAQIEDLRKQIAQTTENERSATEKRLRDRLQDKARGEFKWIPAGLPAARVLEGDFDLLSEDGRTFRETTAKPNELHRHHAAELMTGFFSTNSYKTDAKQDAWYVDVWLDASNRPDMIGVQISNGMYGRLGWRTGNFETYYWGNDTSKTLEQSLPWSDPKRVKRIGDLPSESGWQRLLVPFDALIKGASGQDFTRVGMAWIHSGGRVRWADSGLELRTDKATELQLAETGVRKWWEQPYNRQFYQRRTSLTAALKKAADKRDHLQADMVTDLLNEHSQHQLVEDLRALESKLFVMRSRALPVLVSKRSEQRKTTRVLNRGDYQDESGPIVRPAVPEFLTRNPMDKRDKVASRLDLARWLFNEGSPLVARVYVNRLWHQFYGRGLSETLEDLGTQGDWPSHIELLDWLAAEFRACGWDRNHMIRLLTSTKAYQLSSKPTPDLDLRDTDNRWHARQGRFRITAEAIRDIALQSAGLLQSTEAIPVQSFFPYQPDAYWTRSDKVMYGSRHMPWETSTQQSQYSRTVYTFWKRQNIHPTMLAFDAPTRQECTAKRNITNTPGQALALMNDPMFVEAARVLAMRLCESDASETGERISLAYRWTLQRDATEDEISILSKLLSDQMKHYKEHTDDAKELVTIGQASAPEDPSVVRIAAWTAVTRTILNLHEFLNRQ